MKTKKHNIVERNANATPVIGGYTLDLYCCVCNGSKHEGAGFIAHVTTDGPKCYYEARRIARRMGWVFHKDGYVSCPKCAD